MDRFPEAFNRFEERVNLKKLESASELISSFAYWASFRYVGTQKQLNAIRIESEKRKLGFDWDIPIWIKKKDYWKYHQKSVIEQKWQTSIKSGQHRGFKNKQILIINEGIKKGYSANKIQIQLKNKGIGIRRKVLLRQIREMRMKSPKVNSQKYIPKKYRKK